MFLMHPSGELRVMSTNMFPLRPLLLIYSTMAREVTLCTPAYLSSATVWPSFGMQTTPTSTGLSTTSLRRPIGFYCTTMETRRHWKLDRRHGDFARHAHYSRRPSTVSFQRCRKTCSNNFGRSPFSDTTHRRSEPMLLRWHMGLKRHFSRILWPL